jgi:plasmid maintenance system antidote protein VapI
MTFKVSPKDILREEIEVRGWNAQVLASEAGWTPRLAAEVLQGRRITRLLAIGLAAAFGTSEQLWVNLQAAYDAPEGEAPAKRGRARKAQLVTSPAAPVVHVNGTETVTV